MSLADIFHGLSAGGAELGQQYRADQLREQAERRQLAQLQQGLALQMGDAEGFKNSSVQLGMDMPGAGAYFERQAAASRAAAEKSALESESMREGIVTQRHDRSFKDARAKAQDAQWEAEFGERVRQFGLQNALQWAQHGEQVRHAKAQEGIGYGELALGRERLAQDGSQFQARMKIAQENGGGLGGRKLAYKPITVSLDGRQTTVTYDPNTGAWFDPRSQQWSTEQLDGYRAPSQADVLFNLLGDDGAPPPAAPYALPSAPPAVKIPERFPPTPGPNPPAAHPVRNYLPPSAPPPALPKAKPTAKPAGRNAGADYYEKRFGAR